MVNSPVAILPLMLTADAGPVLMFPAAAEIHLRATCLTMEPIQQQPHYWQAEAPSEQTPREI